MSKYKAIYFVAIIKRITESVSVLSKRGIKAHFWARLQPYLLLVLEVCNVKPIYRKSCAANLLMFSDLTLDPSFKVKQG